MTDILAALHNHIKEHLDQLYPGFFNLTLHNPEPDPDYPLMRDDPRVECKTTISRFTVFQITCGGHLQSVP